MEPDVSLGIYLLSTTEETVIISLRQLFPNWNNAATSMSCIKGLKTLGEGKTKYQNMTLSYAAYGKSYLIKFHCPKNAGAEKGKCLNNWLA